MRPPGEIFGKWDDLVQIYTEGGNTDTRQKRLYRPGSDIKITRQNGTCDRLELSYLVS